MDQAFALGANDQLVDPRAYQNLVIAWRNGAPVRLSAVGSVVGGVGGNWNTVGVVINIDIAGSVGGYGPIAVIDEITAENIQGRDSAEVGERLPIRIPTGSIGATG